MENTSNHQQTSRTLFQKGNAMIIINLLCYIFTGIMFSYFSNDSHIVLDQESMFYISIAAFILCIYGMFTVVGYNGDWIRLLEDTNMTDLIIGVGIGWILPCIYFQHIPVGMLTLLAGYSLGVLWGQKVLALEKAKKRKTCAGQINVSLNKKNNLSLQRKSSLLWRLFYFQ